MLEEDIYETWDGHMGKNECEKHKIVSTRGKTDPISTIERCNLGKSTIKTRDFKNDTDGRYITCTKRVGTLNGLFTKERRIAEILC